MKQKDFLKLLPHEMVANVILFSPFVAYVFQKVVLTTIKLIYSFMRQNWLYSGYFCYVSLLAGGFLIIIIIITIIITIIDDSNSSNNTDGIIITV